MKNFKEPKGSQNNCTVPKGPGLGPFQEKKVGVFYRLRVGFSRIIVVFYRIRILFSDSELCFIRTEWYLLGPQWCFLDPEIEIDSETHEFSLVSIHFLYVHSSLL